MAHHNTILSQILRLTPRHEFKQLSIQHDGKRRSDAMSRWTQFVAMAIAQLSGRSSLRDIEPAIHSQKHLSYHLGSGPIKRTTLGRANQDLDFRFYEALFSKLYTLCQKQSGQHRFRFKENSFPWTAHFSTCQ